MSYNNSQILTCPDLQAALNNQFLCHTGKVTEKLGTIDFLMNPLNTNGVLRKQLNHGDSKKRMVELKFKPRDLEAVVSSDTTLSCDGGAEPGEMSEVYELPEDGVSVAWSIDHSKLHENCDSLEQWIAEEFERKFDVLKRALNRISVQGILQEFGNHAKTGNSNAVPVQTLITGGVSGDSFSLISDVSEEYMENASCNQPFVFGARELWNYFRRVDANCCADRGQDLQVFAQQNGVGMIYDLMVGEEFGNFNDFYALAPGAIQPLWWNKFAGPGLTLNDDSFKQGIIVDPKTDIPYDYVAKYDCGKWNFQLALNYKVVAPPADLFCVGDRLEGVNWVTHWVISNS